MKVIWDREALEELRDSAGFYEDREPGLGEDFLSEMDAALERVLFEPEAPRILEQDCRKMRLDRFPYVLIYLVLDGAVKIVTVMHQKREPGYWHERL